MKLSEQIGVLTKDVEKARYPEDKDAYKRICEYIAELKNKTDSLYTVAEILKQIDNVQYMMHCYMPKSGFYDAYGSRTKYDDERSYKNLAREKKRLLAILYKLKTQIEKIPME